MGSGAVECSPATQPLRKYPIRVDSDFGISVDIGSSISAKVSTPQISSDIICIIGAGAAGTACAEELLDNGFEGVIKLVTKEDVKAPYDRTLISKRFATVPYSSILNSPNVSFQNQTEVLSINPIDKKIRVKSIKPDDTVKCGPKKQWEFNELSYTKLVLATGLEPKILFPHISTVTLYTAKDAELLNTLVAEKDVVVIGGGLLGVETGANLLQRKRANRCKTTSIIMSETEPAGELYGKDIGKVVRNELERMGITIHSGSSAVNATTDYVELENGEHIPYGILVNAVGTYSSADHLSDNIETDEGNKILVNESYCTSDNNVYAIGDCAVHTKYGHEPHWAFAQESGKHAARHIMNNPTNTMHETFVWSAIGGLNLRSVGGRFPDCHKTTFHQNGNRSICLYLNESEHVIGVCTINADPVCATLAGLLATDTVIHWNNFIANSGRDSRRIEIE